MKICPSCERRFAGPKWMCVECGWESRGNGFVELAPGRAAFEADRFDRLARAEEFCFWFDNRRQLISWAMDRFFPRAERFMEVGCGTGFVLDHIAKARKWQALTGAELSVSGLRTARERVPEAELIQMDIRECWFEDEFDLVGAFDVVEHIEQDVTALAGLYRAVSPGGGLLLTVPQHAWLWSRQDELAGHQRRYNRHELHSKLEIVGFEIVYATSFVTFLLPVLLLSRLGNSRCRAEPDANRRYELRPIKAVNRALSLASAWERALLRTGMTFPVGGSMLLAARKAS